MHGNTIQFVPTGSRVTALAPTSSGHDGPIDGTDVAISLPLCANLEQIRHNQNGRHRSSS
ncbi:hypothetical protein ACERK3_01400 [Phycisphaerales bacterium AB-hyl4]|uniref:Uncharacterized protein n=1 Tax=Natronomicrosphaera hydrolytica TaxID=3242702 RepID=A0ABV4U013_9BACT